MNYKFYILIIILLQLSFKGFSQFDDSVTQHIFSSLNGSINTTKDGVNYLFNNALGYSIRKKSIDFNARSSYVYGQNPTKKTNNDFGTSVDFNIYNKTRTFYYWGLLNYTSSYSLNIINQGQYGLGAAVNIVDNKSFKFNISDGFLYENSNILENNINEIAYNTIRNSLRIILRYTSSGDLVKVSMTNMFQPSMKDFNDYLIVSTTTVDFKIWKWLNLQSKLNYNKVTRTDKENLLFTYGISISHYF